MLIGFSGGPGSFSEQATLEEMQRREIHDFTTMPLLTAPRVYDNLVSGQIDLGIVPVSNSTHGIVEETKAAQAMHGSKVEEIGRFVLKIEQCLIVQPSVVLSQITEVVGHPQALGQSQATRVRLLPDVPQREWQDTADSVRALAQGEIPATAAVVASRRAAELYGMNVLQVVNDRDDNETTFIVVRRKGDGTGT